MNIDLDYSWSTHKPLLQSLLKIFNYDLIVELGLGVHSTPMFIESQAKQLIFIENDKDWLEHMKTEQSFDDRCQLIFHDLGPGIQLGTKKRELTEEQKLSIINYYKDFSNNIVNQKNKLLFVDNFACARTLAIQTLYSSFDTIVYHDCQPKGIKWYEYQFDETLYSNYDNFILVCDSAWTGCFIKKGLTNKELLTTAIAPFIEEFSNKNKINNGSMYLK